MGNPKVPGRATQFVIGEKLCGYFSICGYVILAYCTRVLIDRQCRAMVFLVSHLIICVAGHALDTGSPITTPWTSNSNPAARVRYMGESLIRY